MGYEVKRKVSAIEINPHSFHNNALNVSIPFNFLMH